VWNEEGLIALKDVILCDPLIRRADVLGAGFRNVQLCTRPASGRMKVSLAGPGRPRAAPLRRSRVLRGFHPPAGCPWAARYRPAAWAAVCVRTSRETRCRVSFGVVLVRQVPGDTSGFFEKCPQVRPRLGADRRNVGGSIRVYGLPELCRPGKRGKLLCVPLVHAPATAELALRMLWLETDRTAGASFFKPKQLAFTTI
jgi:hypothetical protein